MRGIQNIIWCQLLPNYSRLMYMELFCRFYFFFISEYKEIHVLMLLFLSCCHSTYYHCTQTIQMLIKIIYTNKTEIHNKHLKNNWTPWICLFLFIILHIINCWVLKVMGYREKIKVKLGNLQHSKLQIDILLISCFACKCTIIMMKE